MDFNILFFSIFRESVPTFWPAYFFTTAATAMSAFIINLSRENWFLRDSFLGLPLVYSSCVYCAAQFALAFLAVSIPNLSPMAANVTQATLMAFYAAASASALLKKGNAAHREYTIEHLAVEVESLASSVKNASARNKLIRLHKTVREIVGQQYENDEKDRTRQTSQCERSGQNLRGGAPIGGEMLEKINELKSFAEDAQEFKEEIGFLCDEITAHFAKENDNKTV